LFIIENIRVKRIMSNRKTAEKGTATDGNRRAIVSSEHLALNDAWQLSELEYGLIMAQNGLLRWMTRCMAAAGYPDLSALDTMVLHNVNHRSREKRLTDIAFMLNIEDSHTVNYSLKKLIKADLVNGQKRGKEIFYSATPAGVKACEDYREIRDQCLVDAALTSGGFIAEMGKAATVLRNLSGLYDQAARTATSL